MSKVLEHIVFSKNIKFIEATISSVQFRFHGGHSTTQQLLVLYNDAYDCILAKSRSAVIFLDNFTKVFDTVPHNALLHHLRCLGVCGSVWLWLQSYLSWRQQCVCLVSRHSDILPVISGDPQGSILGHILFLVYINVKNQQWLTCSLLCQGASLPSLYCCLWKLFCCGRLHKHQCLLEDNLKPFTFEKRATPRWISLLYVLVEMSDIALCNLS